MIGHEEGLDGGRHERSFRWQNSNPFHPVDLGIF